MAVAVVVPWRPGCPHRESAWGFVRSRWSTFYAGWELITGTCPDGPWSKGLAVADALTRTDADVVILADADVWCDGIDAAVDVVTAGLSSWAIPHWSVHRLDEPSTAAVLDGGPLDRSSVTLARRAYPGYPGGGLTVVTRPLLDEAPVDPRFVGWGQEDQAAALAWQTLAGSPWRGPADLFHLWHPPQPRASVHAGSAASGALWRRYQQASVKRDAMRSLTTEARHALAEHQE